jgi:hypothetical protein
MSITPEGKVKRKVQDLLNQYGAWHNWPVPAGYGAPMLDCVGCHGGRFFAIETKSEGKKLTPRQDFMKENMEASGGRVFVVTGLNEDNNPNSWAGWTELESWLMQHS